MPKQLLMQFNPNVQKLMK